MGGAGGLAISGYSSYQRGGGGSNRVHTIVLKGTVSRLDRFLGIRLHILISIFLVQSSYSNYLYINIQSTRITKNNKHKNSNTNLKDDAIHYTVYIRVVIIFNIYFSPK